MLIYNFQKEFVGIDEKDLRALGFKNLAELRTEVIDFADLFVKTPGYVHNFKHVHWIDFITCGESNEDSKVIISVNSKNYTATIAIYTVYLTDSPSSKAYIVHLNNLRALTQKESEHISGDLSQKELINVPPIEQESTQFNTDIYTEEFIETKNANNTETTDTVENITIDPYEAPLDINLDDDVFVDDKSEKLNLSIEEVDTNFISKEERIKQEKDISNSDIDIKNNQDDEAFDNSYIYDPKIASEELGLPIDLIEEFIQDFIEQAKEFKTPIYDALNNGDIENLKILSHKLKGVAANLRIEDAFEVLSIINTSEDTTIIESNLNQFYKIIAKLSGENISTLQTELQQNSIEIQDEPEIKIEEDDDSDFDEIVIDFKEDDDVPENNIIEPIEIDDDSVPDKIKLPELADDSFISDDEISKSIEDVQEDVKIDLDLEDTFLEDDITITNNENAILDISYSITNTAKEIGIDIESFKELFKDYTNEATQIIKDIKNNILNKDLQSCKNNALKLKGMSNNMRITDFLNELDTIINASNTNNLDVQINKISDMLNKISHLED